MPLYQSVIPSTLFIDPVATYGCAFDHRVVFDGACSTGANTKITSATINFTNADLNKRIVLTGAGASGVMYAGTITNVDSATQVTVNPVISTTVSSKGLQVHTDDLAAWTALISDLNNSPYSGGVIQMRSGGTTTDFTNRSGISSFLPIINKTVRFEGIVGGHTADIGDYSKIGGSCIAYVGTSTAPTAFGAMLTIAPSTGTTAQALKQVALTHFWLDCRNGDGNAALKGLLLQSCHAFLIRDFFVMDAAAIAIEFGVVGPGLAVPNAGSLGEAKDCTRGLVQDVSVRCLELPAAGAQTAAVTTTSAIALTTSGQTLGGIGANTLTTAGYAWVETACGYPVLVNYTGGGGTASLTGCTVSASDAINVPTTVSGSNIVQACPANACAILLDGDTTANTNLTLFESIQVSHGTTWGPAAVDFRNSDSNTFLSLIINGGNNTNDGAINRIRKPGVRLNGSNVANTLAARNNIFLDGSAGGNPAGSPPGANFGGVCAMGINNAGARLTAQSGPTYWDRYQLANNEPVPIAEGGAYFDWQPNGGWRMGQRGSSSIATQTINAATTALVVGSLITVPPQGFQIGTVIRWTIMVSKTAAGTAARGHFIKVGTAGTTADANIATMNLTPTAVVDVGELIIQLTVRGPLGATCAGVARLSKRGIGVTGLGTVNGVDATMATWNSTTAQQFMNVTITTGASEVLTITQCTAEIINAANP